mgnify:CR=1 FL=1
MEFPYGTILKEVPPEFVPPEMWPEYGTIADPHRFCKREYVGDDPQGLRWSLWPLCLEEYWGDKEPNLEKSRIGDLAYNRILIWKRISRTDKPKGWFQSSSSLSRIDGYQFLKEGDFTDTWHKNARRDLRIWQESHLNKTHTIEEITFEEYKAAYFKSIIAKRVGKDRVYALEQKYTLPYTRTHTILYGVRNIQTKKIVAGTAIIFSPTFKSSTHVAPFIHEEGRDIFAATGLIHHWFLESKRKNIPCVMTINFWYPGQPKGWKGFSEFKSHFGFQYVAYPPTLYRFARGKIF